MTLDTPILHNVVNFQNLQDFLTKKIWQKKN